MATHRPNNSHSRHELLIISVIYDALTVLESRRRPITAQTVARALQKNPGFIAPISLEYIAGALPQIQRWRSQAEIAPLLEHRRQLVRLERYYRERQQAVIQDLKDLEMLVDDIDKLLEQKGLAGNPTTQSLQ